MKERQLQISDRELLAMERQLQENKASDRAHYESGNGMNRGPMLRNGRYEWIAVGGGRRRYWSEKYQEYVEIRGEKHERGC